MATPIETQTADALADEKANNERFARGIKRVIDLRDGILELVDYNGADRCHREIDDLIMSAFAGVLKDAEEGQ